MSLKWLALLFLVLTFYLLLGGLVFHLLERDHEENTRQTSAEYFTQLLGIIYVLVSEQYTYNVADVLILCCLFTIEIDNHIMFIYLTCFKHYARPLPNR